MNISLLGCGWLGLPLGQALVHDGFQVWGSTTTPGKLITLELAGLHPVLLSLQPELSLPPDDPFFQTDALIISIPPKRKTGSIVNYLLQLKALAERIEECNFSGVVMFSTTGVYPERSGDFKEDDADIENELWQAEEIIRSAAPRKTTIVRFGGLLGPGRHPGKFLAGKKDVPNGGDPVNLIHKHDAIQIVSTIIKQQVWGETFNAVAKEHPLRQEFYTSAALSLGLEPPDFKSSSKVVNRIIDGDYIRLKLKYTFKYDDPMIMLQHCPV